MPPARCRRRNGRSVRFSSEIRRSWADRPTANCRPRPLNLSPTATETTTGRFMFGVGVNSDAGLFGSIVIDEQNFNLFRFPRRWDEVKNFTAFRGDGQRLRLEAVPGTQVQRYSASWQNPYLFDTQNSLGVSGYYYSRQFIELVRAADRRRRVAGTPVYARPCREASAIAARR